MKNVFFGLVLALAMTAVSADDKITEVTGSVGCAHCDLSVAGVDSCKTAIKVGDKVYLLTGKVDDAAKKGDWTVKGKVAADGKSIEVTEMKKAEKKG